MKKNFLIIIFAISLSPVFAQNWRMISPTYATTETVVVGYSVADYGATGDGVTDVTNIFQNLLNLLGNNGGGTLWVPAGKYVIKGNLTVPEGVTLRGDWQQPVKGQPVTGTILMAYTGRGDTSQAAFISLQAASAIMDVTIWYPDQLPDDIVPYSPAIGFLSPTLFCSAQNITLVNAYEGFMVTLGGAGPMLINIYGTPLAMGIDVDGVGDPGKVENIDFSPSYWEGSGLPNSPTAGSPVETWIRQHGTGIFMGDNETTYISFSSIDGYNIGVWEGYSRSDWNTANGSVYGVLFSNCNMGVYVDGLGDLGVMFSRVNMVNCTNGIVIGPSLVAPGGRLTTSGSALFHTCTIDASQNAIATDSNSNATLMLEHCTITSGKVNIGGGTFMPTDCDINNSSPQITLGSNSRGIVTSDRFKNTFSIQNNSPYQCAINDTAVTFKQMPSFPTVVPLAYMPSRKALYIATSAPFNAKNDGVTDNTTAIQNALNQAASDGGGTVFLPPGRYEVYGNLTVPSNVELMGSSDISTAPEKPEGSILEVYAGRGSATGTPFIQLSAGSGMRGFFIDYPQELGTSIEAYPYCIQVAGSNVYVINIAMLNVYNGIDLFTYKCDNHYIDFVTGTILNQGFRVGGNSVGGKIYNFHINPVFFAVAHDNGWPAYPTDYSDQLYPYINTNCDLTILGNCQNETLYNDFEYGVHQGLTYIPDGSSGPSGIDLAYAMDGTEYPAVFQGVGASGFDIINGQFIAVGPPNSISAYFTTTPSFTGQVNFFNSSHDSWSIQSDVVMNGGTLNMEQPCFNRIGENHFAAITSGKLIIQNGSLHHDQDTASLLTNGTAPNFFIQSSVVDSVQTTTSQCGTWKDNLSTNWIYGGRSVTQTIPGKIQLQNYNTGGLGVAYGGTTANYGGQYRLNEGVSIANCSEGGYEICFINAGEWIKYNVNVAQAGVYTLQVRAQFPGSNDSLHVEIDGVNISGNIPVPNTGNYSTWQTVSVTTSALTVGAHVLRIYMPTGGFNLEYLNFIYGIAAPAPVITGATSASGYIGSAFTYAIAASNTPTSYSATGLPAGLNINDSTGVISGVAQDTGTTNIAISAANATGTGYSSLVVSFAKSTAESPFGGTAQTIPGQVLAYDFDNGGQGVAYYDTDPTNNGGQYRLDEGVDIQTSAEEASIYAVGWMWTGEWMKYTVNVTQTGTYILQARVTSGSSGDALSVQLDGTTIGTVNVPNTGGSSNWQTVSTTTSTLSVGQHTLLINVQSGGCNLEYLNFVFMGAPTISSATTATGTIGSVFTYNVVAANVPTSYHATGLPVGLLIDTTTGAITGIPTSTGTYNATISASNAYGTGSQNIAFTITASIVESPYAGTVAYIPGQVFAYNYDNGGEGVAYHDDDDINHGGQYRPSEGVDIENCSEGLYDVGFTGAGQWMKYTVNVTEAGIYTLQVRVTSPNTGTSVHVILNGINISGSIVIPNTGGWQNWQTVTVTTPPLLTTGVQTLEIYEETGGFNIEYLTFSLDTPQACSDGALTMSVPEAIGNTYQWQVNTGSGFTNITDDSIYVGSNTYELVLFTASPALYNYQYQCAVTNNSVTTYSTVDALEFGDTWTGAESTAWEDPNNWSCGNVPDSNTDVIINAGTIITNSNITIRSLRVYPGVQVTAGSGYTFTVLH